MRGLLRIIFAYTVIILSGCNNNSHNYDTDTPYWDDIKRVYIIPSENMTYYFEDTANLIIAPANQLPEDILMCAVDTTNNDCITLIRLGESKKISYQYATSSIARITRQTQNVKYQIVKNIIEPEIINENISWHFDTRMKLIHDTDTINVAFTGNIFNTEKSVIAAVVTENVKPNDALRNTKLMANIGTIQ